MGRLKAVMNFLKGGGIEGAIKGEAKRWLLIILSVVLAFLLIVAGLEALKNAFLCNSVIKISCPKPPVDMDKITDLAKDVEEERNDIYDDLEDQTTNQKFRGIDEIAAAQGGDTDEKFSEAEYYIRTMAQIDFKTYLEYIRPGDLKKDKPLDKSPIDYSLKYAKEDYDEQLINLFKTKEAEAKKFKKNKSHYIMNWRIKVYECYLLDEGCNDEILKSMGTESYKGVAIAEKDDDFKYPQINTILEKFYEISFIKYLDGKVKKVPAGESKTMFNAMLADEQKVYNELYPPVLPESSPFSVGWLIPMIEGTYNFASPFGMRWGKPHQGVDMGTNKVNAVPYFAAKGGTVVSAGWNDGGYGGVVTIDHGDGYFSTYSHMETKNIVVKRGQTVSQGQLIGASGGQPNLAIHLHFEICTSVNDSSGYDLSGGKMKICGERVNPENADLYGNSLHKNQDMAKTQQYAKQFLNEWKKKALGGEAIIMPGFTPLGGLGVLSEEYEGSPAKCNRTYENAGRDMACGAWQLTDTSIGGFLEHLKKHKPEYYSRFKGLTYTSYNTTFGDTWAKLYKDDPKGFYNAQHEYIYISHYDSVRKYIIRDWGFDPNTRSRAIQEVWWSISVQHRYNVSNYYFGDAIGNKWKTMSDKEMIDALYQYRINRWSCCTTRYKSEWPKALKILGSDAK